MRFFQAYLTIFLLAAQVQILAQSTSPAAESLVQPEPPVPAANASEVITFSEFPIGTPISTQYRDIGVIFGGSGPFISPDGANPTSPVLSGTPRFQGDITAVFVAPGTDRPAVVESFAMDAGYFDEIGSTRIEWFDPEGLKLGQRINSHLGIERFMITGGNIASFRIGIVQNEPAGYAIDNVQFVPVGPSVLFREKSEKDGSWGFLVDEIPGFDHVGFHSANMVWESHPGYPSGNYVSADGQESIFVQDTNGVQSQHSRATFEHDSRSVQSTPVTDFEEIPIQEDLARQMESAIESVSGFPFQFIDYSLDGLEATLSPEAQKGGNGSFTCVGLVEWASEEAGHNDGEGFVRNSFESFHVPDPRTFPPSVIEVPLLSPQLLNYAMKGQRLLSGARQWLQGLFDPVDFIVTDPLGRRLGFQQDRGLSQDIPNSFFSGDGGVEQFLIPNPIPGLYTIDLAGTGDEAFAAVGTSGSSLSFQGFLASGDGVSREIFVAPKAGTGGDVDGDGDVDRDDIEALLPRLNRFTDGLGDPGDLDGDGLLSDADLELLSRLVEILSILAVDIDVLPGSAENKINPASKGVIPVAILGAVELDVTKIDRGTLVFGPLNASPAHAAGGHIEDVNGDGIMDLVSHYRVQETGIVEGVREACTSASTQGGRVIRGCDSIRFRSN